MGGDHKKPKSVQELEEGPFSRYLLEGKAHRAHAYRIGDLVIVVSVTQFQTPRKANSPYRRFSFEEHPKR